MSAAPTPGDVGRFTLHMDPETFADDLAAWCIGTVELNQVARWMEVVAVRLRRLNEATA